MHPGSIESKRPTEPVPRARQTVPSPHPPSLCIATRSAPLRVARLPPSRAPYPRTSPHFAQWINQAEWWGTRHRVHVYVHVYIPISDEARRNSVASIYYNKRDVKRGGQTLEARDISMRITRIAHADRESSISPWKREWLVTIRFAW